MKIEGKVSFAKVTGDNGIKMTAKLSMIYTPRRARSRDCLITECAGFINVVYSAGSRSPFGLMHRNRKA